MRKCYLSKFTIKFFLGLFTMLCSMSIVSAQTVVINTGTAGTPQYNAGPIYRSSTSSTYNASRYSYLYTASELAAAGIAPGSIITVVGWSKNNTATATRPAIFRIYMKNSAAADFSASSIPWTTLNAGATMVYENLSFTVPATSAPDYITFPLTNQFIYTGGSLEISTEWDINPNTGNASTGTFEWLWSTVPDRVYGTGDNDLVTITSLSSTTNSISTIDDRRPFIQITYTPGGPCVNPPVPGTVTSSASIVCMGESFTLTSSGGTNGTGQTLQWQSSPDNITWTDIPGANSGALTTTQSASTYYQLVVTCGVSVSSNSVQVQSPTAVHGTFTINSAVPTGGTNFQTFNEAYDYIKCGIDGAVIFNVDPLSGPYTEQLILTEVPGASAANTITFNGNGRVLQYLSTNTSQRGTIMFDGADHFRFDSLEIKALGSATGEYGFGIHFSNSADSNIINRCLITADTTSTSTNFAGIVTSGTTTATGTGTVECDFNQITNNIIIGGYYGITVVSSSTTANRDYVIQNNEIREFYYYGTYVYGSYNILLDNNEYTRPTRSNVSNFYGIYFTNLSTAARVSNNRMHNAFGGEPDATSTFAGLYVTGCDGFVGFENRFFNNLIYNIGGAGDIYGIYNSSSDNVWFHHNTFHLDGDGAGNTTSDFVRGFYQTTLAGGIQVKNNIFHIDRGGLAVKHGFYYNTATSQIESDYNNIYFSTTTGDLFTGRTGGTDYIALVDWQTASTGDANSVANNPLYEDATTGNFRPTNASIDNLGTPLNILTDITGLARSTTTPDLGAYEFTPGACTAPPTAGTISFSENPVCEGSTVGLSVVGNSTGLNQTYRWESSASATGPFADVSGSLENPIFSVTASANMYYRLAVTCSGVTRYSDTVLLQVTPWLPQGNYTINAGAPASATNFQSFNEAYQAMRCGIAGWIVFDVAPNSGPYNEQLIMEQIQNASATNTITFNGNGNTIRFSSDVTGERAVIKLRGTDHVTFDSLIIDASGTGSYGWGVQLINDADSNTINNCIINIPMDVTSSNYAGIVMSNSETGATTSGNTFCDNNTFSNNTINGGYYGITMIGGTAGNEIHRNKIINNKIFDFYFYGIYAYRNQDAVIEYNHVARPTRTNSSTFYGIYLTTGHIGLKVSKNRIYQPFEAEQSSTSTFYGIYISSSDPDATQPNVMSNNAIYDVKGGGSLYGFYSSGSDNAKWYHNTLTFDDQNYSGTSLARGLYMITAADGVEFKNNLVQITRTGSGTNIGIYKTSTYDIASDYNNFRIRGADSHVGYNSGYMTTLAAWQASSGQDMNSLTLAPFFTSPATGNLAPMNPQLDDEGTPIAGITTDIEDEVRSTTAPDIGAYEFAVPPCTTPPVAGTATATPNSAICMGDEVFLSLDGYNVGAGQTYQWQYATTTAGPWNDMGGPRMFPDTTIFADGTLYYRVAVTCSGNTSFSVPALVSLNPAFVSGDYTIDPALPAGGTNFQSFAEAVAALYCGIDGWVNFHVASGTYNEQIRIGDIGGTAPDARVTFMSATGNPADVTLTYESTASAENYTLLLDSSKYFTFKNMTIAATGTSYGRVIELRSDASYDSLLNLVVNTLPTTTTSNARAGIFADDFLGEHNVIKQNTVNNGNYGIYLAGVSTTSLTLRTVIDSNTVSGFRQYGIYVGYHKDAQVTHNKVTMDGGSTTHYGFYNTNSDSAFVFKYNEVTITNATSTAYGMYFTSCNAAKDRMANLMNNKVLATTGNTTTLYGMYVSGSDFIRIINNTISVNSDGASSTCYGFYHTSSGGDLIYNNTIVNNSNSTSTSNIAAYITGSGDMNRSQNNIFAHYGGGRAMSMPNTGVTYSNYNTFYTTGLVLITQGSNNYGDLWSFVDAVYWDLNSIVVEPALMSPTDLRPNLDNPLVWAIHGRGEQIPGNDQDFNGAARATTLTTGVPDMGAYEFLPNAEPTVLTGVPAVPAPGITQYFMYGSDTVARVTYDATAPVPASISLQRYSGVLPTGLSTGQESMYFYTKFTVPQEGDYKFKLEQLYIDPWQGFIPTELHIKLGRTDTSDTWQVNEQSTLDHFFNTISDTALNYFDRFTGLMGDPAQFTVPPYSSVTSSSSRGTRFWVPYGHHQDFSGSNNQDMLLYLSAEDSANVTVSINGTMWTRHYTIPANSVRVSDLIPKSGLWDARVMDEGLYEKGIKIVSDVPITAYAHIYGNTNSGATILLPVGVYGYEYQSLNFRQYYPGENTYSWVSVMTDRDSTLVEITPAVDTKHGKPAGVPFTVYLNAGEVYNVMGTITGSVGTDMTGTKVRAIANARGECYPIAVFSGSSRTAICYTTNGDNFIQQVFPSQAWGRKYLTFATANATSNTTYNSNIFRVMVKDPTTVVTHNGVILDPTTLVTPGNFYEFSTTSGDGPNGAVAISADKPVMVAQYMVSSGATGCAGVTAPGNGDPEMIYISPIEQGINQVVSYSTQEYNINTNYVNIVIPTAGLASLTIDGNPSTTFTDVFPHPYLAGYSCVRHNLPASAGQHRVQSDSTFTFITYGLGSAESYGYNGGANFKNLQAIPSFANTLATGVEADYTCVGAPVRFNMLITTQPSSLTWKFSEIDNLTPNADIVQNNPVPVDSMLIDGRMHYLYSVQTDYVFTTAGSYSLPIILYDPLTIDGCASNMQLNLAVNVLPAPVVDFTTTFSGCLGDPIQFNGTAATNNNATISSFNWDFDNGETSTVQNPSLTYTTSGTYDVNLSIVSSDGCIGDTTKPIDINTAPSSALVNDSVLVCVDSSATFQIADPMTGATYDWYTDTLAAPVAQGTSYTVNAVTGVIEIFVRATNSAGCVGFFESGTATLLPDLAAPIAYVDTAGPNEITFAWDPVIGAGSYEVSENGGTTWITPSSGATGTTHTISGLPPLTEASIIVRAIGVIDCQESVSDPVTGRTLTDQIFIPNAFSPNGDGLNDVLLVYGYTIQTLKFVVYNQWGEKIFESNNQATGWNGEYKNKPQPSGVYMYVCQMTLRDGTTQVKKGSINLVR